MHKIPIISLLKRISKIFGYVVIFGIIFVICALLLINKNLPDYEFLKKYSPPLTTKIYSIDGKLIDEIYKENRVFVKIQDIPKELIQAFIIAEDKNFFIHKGFDLIGILRALKNNILDKKSEKQGASTITQQVVKNFLLTSDKLLSRKIKEIMLAYKISKVFSKKEILELYLNQIYLGNGSYGVLTAAQNYFNKDLKELTLDEAALLAALPKSPSRLNPKKHYDKALERRNYILSRMYQESYISEEKFKNLKEKKIELKNFVNKNKIEAKYYAEKVKKEAIEILGEEFLYNSGLTIVTCLDSKIQENLQEALRTGIVNYDKKHYFRGALTKIDLDNWQEELKKIVNNTLIVKDAKIAVVLEINDEIAKLGLIDNHITNIYLNNSKWTKKDIKSLKEILEKGDVILVKKLNSQRSILYQVPEVDGALMIINHKSGKILASEGGYDFNKSQFDRASQSERQIGSLIKPFIYLTALENGILPNEIFYDEYTEIYQGENSEAWIPKNHDGKFLGPITLRKALEKSRNTVTVRITQTIGQKKIFQNLKKLGITNQEIKIDSLSLGAINSSLEKITTAYGVIGNNGKKLIPQYIEYIKEKDGNIIFKRDSAECINCSFSKIENNIKIPNILKKSSEELIDKASNYQILSILDGAVKRGTVSGFKSLKLKNLAGKTGTTNNGTDTWTIAITPELTIGCFVGFDNTKTLGERSFGSNTTLPIIHHLLVNLIQKNLIRTDLEFKIPKDINLVAIDYDTGKTIKDSTNSQSQKVIYEAFKIENFESSENFG
ncbi:MAG: PBP1A family penicillin-binding protein [Rickettsia sp.]|nr:PBP1A family penicillin-binding protein [Rickettsia sp.]